MRVFHKYSGVIMSGQIWATQIACSRQAPSCPQLELERRLSHQHVTQRQPVAPIASSSSIPRRTVPAESVSERYALGRRGDRCLECSTIPVGARSAQHDCRLPAGQKVRFQNEGPAGIADDTHPACLVAVKSRVSSVLAFVRWKKCAAMMLTYPPPLCTCIV